MAAAVLQGVLWGWVWGGCSQALGWWWHRAVREAPLKAVVGLMKRAVAEGQRLALCWLWRL